MMHNGNNENYAVLKTSEFTKWHSRLDPRSALMVTARLDMLSIGHFGNHKRFDGLIELRWKNGMRVYSFIWKKLVIVVLNGGNKNGQARDIKKAKKIRDQIIEEAYTV